MAARYFVERPVSGERAALTGSEAHHLAHVMRAKAGDRVVLFDGSGVEFTAEVRQVGRGRIELDVLARAEVDRELPFRLTLGAALPKGDRQKWLVEKAVELGVTRLVPLDTSRGVAQPAASTLSRLRRAVIEASKQCGRNRLMEIAPSQTWVEYLRAAPPEARRIVAHPDAALLNPSPFEGEGRVRVAVETQAPVHSARAVFLAIGPEGGLTDEEVSAAHDAGWRMMDLGPRILRIETAAVLLVALVAVD